MTAKRAALERLTELDRTLRETHGELVSLCPGRAQATSLGALGERALSGDVPAEVVAAFGDGLARIAESQWRHFPRNVFWDLDYVAACLVRQGTASELSPVAGAARVEQTARLVDELEAAYGCHSPIRFRYVHDFVYGFDWARWVAADPGSRSTIGPFDAPFLEYLLRRAEEIVALIQAGDGRYGPLRPGEDRNTFRFVRDPAAEVRLHRDLAARGLIPVEGWRYDAEPSWDRPYADLRDARAEELGLIEES